MAPFSTCSICNVKTRKVVKDPITLKMIYVCPVCFKARNQQQKQPMARKDQIDKVEVNEPKMVKSISQNEVPLDKRNETEPMKTSQAKRLSLQTQDNASVARKSAFKAPMPPPIPKMKSLITPPIMQTVIVNGRKYVAISETADD
ncbi:uncharacterized protein Dwil_GK14509 [Drosophila willistoni]|uniref:Uncharacterized protein n=1 Tax=Drosophila willistoni TaxID=7260 RepID=B4NKK1_DROWI|nr:uncharacterized protein LOC6651276 [Drosophila willistoni]XP_046865333.1 uncharacterized protein LOC6651276 [Drosophila willistoni]XP_046865334.1 uncharacterized protein LOC6651276 [Drosophila willistoni]EDW85173.2 uncharacterized protein Dwil_GK14509 [Drosophila willistoni]